jgi:hypothetical protein
MILMKIDLNQLNKKLNQLKEELNRPTNISIQQKSTSFIDQIFIQLCKFNIRNFN